MAILKVANVWFNAAGTQYLANVGGEMTFSTSITATDFNATSDATLKNNIIVIDSALDKIDEISGVKFNWKLDGKSSAGVIAQEVEKILPEIVSNINNHKTVNYSGIIALLVQAIKELREEIKTIRTLNK